MRPKSVRICAYWTINSQYTGSFPSTGSWRCSSRGFMSWMRRKRYAILSSNLVNCAERRMKLLIWNFRVLLPAHWFLWLLRLVFQRYYVRSFQLAVIALLLRFIETIVRNLPAPKVQTFLYLLMPHLSTIWFFSVAISPCISWSVSGLHYPADWVVFCWRFIAMGQLRQTMAFKYPFSWVIVSGFFGSANRKNSRFPPYSRKNHYLFTTFWFCWQLCACLFCYW